VEVLIATGKRAILCKGLELDTITVANDIAVLHDDVYWVVNISPRDPAAVNHSGMYGGDRLLKVLMDSKTVWYQILFTADHADCVDSFRHDEDEMNFGSRLIDQSNVPSYEIDH
jgi:hypothetical protein